MGSARARVLRDARISRTEASAVEAARLSAARSEEEEEEEENPTPNAAEEARDGGKNGLQRSDDAEAAAAAAAQQDGEDVGCSSVELRLAGGPIEHRPSFEVAEVSQAVRSKRSPRVSISHCCTSSPPAASSSSSNNNNNSKRTAHCRRGSSSERRELEQRLGEWLRASPQALWSSAPLESLAG